MSAQPSWASTQACDELAKLNVKKHLSIQTVENLVTQWSHEREVDPID